MDASHQILCLNMIVKDEASVIARCLASVRPIIDYWVIVDTGSTDGTQDAIRALMADMPGELHERPWRDFAHNRTEALELARSRGEYVLIIDADDVLELEPDFTMPSLEADSYRLRIVLGSITYSRPQIVRTALPWRWRGVLHEFLTCDDARTSGLLDGPQIRVNSDGARRRDPQTYRRDAEILHAALQTESDPFMESRYHFYLAQSYGDCGEKEKALEAYLKRAELGFWIEEVFISLYRAAQLQEALGRPFDEVIATYLRAATAVPKRAEALHGASRYCRLSKRYKEGYEISKRAGSFGDAPDGLFVQAWIYEYGLLDELAVNAYWAGAYQDSLDACEHILRERKCPEAERPRIEDNARAARQALGMDPFIIYMDQNFDKVVGACGSKESVLFLTIMREWFSRYNTSGGACEIGVQKGKYLIALHNLLAPCSSLGIDVFADQSKNIDLSGYGSIEICRDNIASFASNPESISLMSTDSLAIGPQDVEHILREHGHFAIFSIDGGHTPIHVSLDFMTASRLTSPTGIIAVDDIFNPDWPGVTEGLYTALARRTSPFVPLYITRKKVFLCHVSHQRNFASFVAERYSKKYSRNIRYVEFFGWRIPSLNFFTHEW